MGIIKAIHHVELETKSFTSICTILIESFGFQMIASTDTKAVLKSGCAVFVVKKSLNQSIIDTVYDVALEVGDVSGLVNNAVKYGAKVIRAPETVTDSNGSIEIAQITSCVGDVVHTLICRKNYKGDFLPHYINVEHDRNLVNIVKEFDHITYVVPRGNSDLTIKWYENVFGMKYFNLNSDSSLTGGFVVEHNKGGMILKAFEYFKCSEVGVKSDSCKFVIGEEINENVPNQIRTFLREHGGAGLQHIGLMVDDIVSAAANFESNGARFLKQPREYYDMMTTRLPMDSLKLSVVDLQKYGILVDSEPNTDQESKEINYLLQVFTKPIFDRETFFLELIERHGAKGFGAGNIKALWDAVEASMESLKKVSLGDPLEQ